MYASCAGLAAFATSWCFTVAVRWGKPSSIASLEFMGILISLIIDIVLYSYSPSIVDLVCGTLLIGGGALVFFRTQTADEENSYVDLEMHTAQYQ